MTSTLVWHQGALGDLILSLPTLHCLKVDKRVSRLHLISRTDICDILIESSLADEVSSAENGLFADIFVANKASQKASEFLRKFSSAFIFMKRPDDVFAENLMKHIPECFFISTGLPEGFVDHMSVYQVEQLKKLGIAGREIPPLKVKQSLLFDHCGKDVITIHPGSGGQKKCWSLDRFLKLMELLDREKRFYFYFILGPAEDPDLHRISEKFISANGIDASLITDRPVSHIAPLLKSATVHIGNDSGITHLASALGTPTIAVFGPTDPKIWGPYGRRVSIVRAGIPCSPCAEKDRRQCLQLSCLDEVKVNDVLLAVEDILKFS